MNLSWVLNGPPFTSGDLHIGHGVNILVKDFCLRYQKTILQQEGFWNYSFDCQGLPIERNVEKQEGDLIENCLKYSNFYFQKGLKTLNKLNLLHQATETNTLLTNSLDYKLALTSFVSKLYQKGLLYKSSKHINYCYNCETSLANAEIESQKIDWKVYVFKAHLKNFALADSILFATTRPETVFLNKALVVHPEHMYGLIKGVLSGAFKEATQVLKGSLLEGVSYELLDRFDQVISRGKILLSDTEVYSNQLKTYEDASILGDYACVGLSPWGDLKDYTLIVNNGIMTEKEIRDSMKSSCIVASTLLKDGSLENLKVEKVYTYQKFCDSCWRCKTKVSYALGDQWYLKISSDSRALLAQVETIKCNNLKLLKETAKFFSNEIDWCISRSRKYGTPLPIFECTKCGFHKTVDYTSLKLSQETFFYSKITQEEPCTCGGFLKQVPFSLDVWIDSGFIPLYLNPSGVEAYETFIEGIDQKRGWFYSTAVLSVLNNGRLPYKGLTYLGWIMNQRKKISKSSNTLVSLETLLDQVDLLNLRSYALSRANSTPAEFSSELINLEKKYVNVIFHLKKLLSMETYTFELSESLIKELYESSFKEHLKELDSLETLLRTKFLQLEFSSYWQILKNHLLLVYSRKLINTHKKDQSFLTRAFLKYYGVRLLKYVDPVLGLS